MPPPHRPLHILIGNDPRAYREALVVAFRARRPEAEVVAVDPVELDAMVARYSPALVVCSALTEAVETRVPAWALLYPDGARLVVSSVAGERKTASDLDLDELLSLADRASA